MSAPNPRGIKRMADAPAYAHHVSRMGRRENSVGPPAVGGVASGELVRRVGSSSLALVLLIFIYISFVDSVAATLTGTAIAILSFLGLVAPRTPLGLPLLRWFTDARIETGAAIIHSGLLTLGVTLAISLGVALFVYVDFLSLFYLFLTAIVYVLAMPFLAPHLFWERRFFRRLTVAIVISLLGGVFAAFAAERGLFEGLYKKVSLKYPKADLAFGLSPTMGDYIGHYEQFYLLSTALGKELARCRLDPVHCQKIERFVETKDLAYLSPGARARWSAFAQHADGKLEQLALNRLDEALQQRRYPSGASQQLGVAIVSTRPRIFAAVSAIAKIIIVTCVGGLLSLDWFSVVLAIAICLAPVPMSRWLRDWSSQYDPGWHSEGHVFLTIVCVGGFAFALLALRALLTE